MAISANIGQVVYHLPKGRLKGWEGAFSGLGVSKQGATATTSSELTTIQGFQAADRPARGLAFGAAVPSDAMQLNAPVRDQKFTRKQGQRLAFGMTAPGELLGTGGSHRAQSRAETADARGKASTHAAGDARVWLWHTPHAALPRHAAQHKMSFRHLPPTPATHVTQSIGHSNPRQSGLLPSRLSGLWGIWILLILNSGAQDIVALSRNGTLNWSNGLPNGSYEVEWSSSLVDGGTWRSDWSQLRGLQGTQPVLSVEVPMFFRVKGNSYPELTDRTECYLAYSNALLNAAVAMPDEISTRLRPVNTNTPGTDWRTFTNWVDGSTRPWVRVATLDYTGSWDWKNLLTPGAHTMSNGYASEIWITLSPDLRQLLGGYAGTNRTLRMEKALGMPPRTGAYGVAEFYVDPKYLFRPAASPDIHSLACGLVSDDTSPYLEPNVIQGLSTGYAAWFNDTLDSRGYAANGNLDSSWPWTRLGYTFDYENTANSPVGLSEYVIPGCSDIRYWGDDLVIPIFVESTYPADTYGL